MLFSPPLALYMYLVFPKMFDGAGELRRAPDGHRDVFQGRDELRLVLGRVVLWKKITKSIDVITCINITYVYMIHDMHEKHQHALKRLSPSTGHSEPQGTHSPGLAPSRSVFLGHSRPLPFLWGDICHVKS